jgi:fructose-1,6-bisphosphatase/inositol monophosphatase family enzyme
VTDLAEDAALAADLVREAGLLAQELRGSALRVDTKSSISDLVTAADLAAERLIVDHLAAFRPDDGVLAEEGNERPSTSGRTWIVDPLDGTYNFVHGSNWWCSAVALVEDGVGLLGAIYHPSEETLYVGGPDVPTTRNGEPLGPVMDVHLADTCLSTYLHPSFFEDAVGATFAKVVRGAATLRMLGSGSMDLTAVAQGHLGVFAQHSVAPWDWWPGSSLVRGAGGDARQLTLDGKVWSVAGAPTAVAEVCGVLEAVSG